MKTFKIIGGVVACLVVVFGAYISGSGGRIESTVYSGVNQGNEYQSTTTDSTWNSFAATAGGFKQLCSSRGALGSIIVSNETVGSFNVYDATTTASHLAHPTTTLAKVYASQAEGTYAYDSIARFGLIVEFQSSNVASTTITYRCY